MCKVHARARDGRASSYLVYSITVQDPYSNPGSSSVIFMKRKQRSCITQVQTRASPAIYSKGNFWAHVPTRCNARPAVWWVFPSGCCVAQSRDRITRAPNTYPKNKLPSNTTVPHCPQTGVKPTAPWSYRVELLLNLKVNFYTRLTSKRYNFISDELF